MVEAGKGEYCRRQVNKINSCGVRSVRYSLLIEEVK